MFIDTHCHLTDKYTSLEDMDAIINNAKSDGVGALICACAEPNDFENAIKIIDKYENVFSTIGIHPEFATKFSESDLKEIEKHLNHAKVVGVGEIGLDYHYGIDDKKRQIELFEKQLNIAKTAKLPVAIHTRDAEDDTANILDGSISGVMHCFTGSWEFAKKMLDRGFYFSASGIITFKNSDELRETFAKIPLDKIVIETDSPYCAPVPYRGKTCEPAFVIETAKIMADIKKLQIDDLETILFENTKRLYPKCHVKL